MPIFPPLPLPVSPSPYVRCFCRWCGLCFCGCCHLQPPWPWSWPVAPQKSILVDILLNRKTILTRPMFPPPPLPVSPSPDVRCLLLGGPVDEFPANFFDFFCEPKSGSAKNLEKSSQQQTDRGTISAAPGFHTSCSPPAYRSIRDRSTMELPILATSRHNARCARCRDVARIGD